MQHSAHVLLSLLLYKMVQSLACVLMAVFCVILGHQVLTFFSLFTSWWHLVGASGRRVFFWARFPSCHYNKSVKALKKKTTSLVLSFFSCTTGLPTEGVHASFAMPVLLLLFYGHSAGSCNPSTPS